MFQNSFLMWTSEQLTFAVLRSMGRNPESGRLVFLVDWLVLGTLSSNPARENLFQKMLMKIMFHHAPSQGSTGLPMPPAPAEIDSQSAIKGPSPTSQAWRLIPLGSLAGALGSSDAGGRLHTGVVVPRACWDFPPAWSSPSCKAVSCSGMAFDPRPLFLW